MEMSVFALLVFAGLAAAQLVSCADFNHKVECGPADVACECDADATVCIFEFYVEYVLTFAKYNNSIRYSQGQGELFYIDDTGNFISYRGLGKCKDGNFVKQTESELYCNDEDFCVDRSKLCAGPITVDSKTYKPVIAVNKQFPGPTLIVREGQIVAVDVHNNLSTEGISIHWHGQHQIKTNFMDGVSQLTQCPILPGTSFRYIFKASPSGTFWYHSHIGSQRGQGLFGAFIVKENEINYPIAFKDDPASHTMTIMDWYERDKEVFFRTLRFAVAQYPSLPPYVFPSDVNAADRYRSTRFPDFTQAGLDPFVAGLINGKGRHYSVPYNRSSVTIYEVEQGETYRFRMIHTGTHYAFRLSIDNHKLKVMATDGYLIQPVEVDYIAIQSGERYDFLLEANKTSANYWIKAETFEINIGDSTAPPYDFHDHKAEAILHYAGSDRPTASEYENIPSSPRECTQENPCTILNCPIGQFHPAYNVECISIDSLRLVEATPESEMPDQIPDVTYFTNIAGYAGRNKPFSSINDKFFVLPQFPLTTHYEKNSENSFCAVNSQCDIDEGCDCTTVLDIGSNVTVRLVISAVGEERNDNHPMHIHGHSVHILGIGRGEYSPEDGRLVSSTRDLTCTEDGDDTETLDSNRCPNPRFRSSNTTFPLDQYTVRKDTFIVPAGGYVVVQFRSDNPGYWLFHCHLHLHQREGMSLVIREDVENFKRPPEEMETCNSFIWDVNDFMEAIQEEQGSGSFVIPSIMMSSFAVALGMLF